MTKRPTITRTMIKTRPTLVKVLANAGIKAVDINGQGKSLEVVLMNKHDYNKFAKHISNNTSSYSTGWGGYVVKLFGDRPLPGSEHDYCNVASRHHY